MSNVLSRDYQKSVKLLTDVFARVDKEVFNSFFAKFEGDAKAIVTIQSNKAGMRIKDGKVLGWCSVKPNWTISNNLKAYEVNVCAEGLSQEWYEVVGTLVHEMVHLKNILENKKDTSRNGTYHNSIFMKTAVAHKLLCRENSSLGYVTEPSQSLKKMVDEWAYDTSFLVSRDERAVKLRASGSITKWYEYSCPDCHESFKTRKSGLNILCACGNHPKFDCKELEPAK